MVVELIVEVVRFSIEQVLRRGLVSNDLRPNASSYGEKRDRCSMIQRVGLYLADGYVGMQRTP